MAGANDQRLKAAPRAWRQRPEIDAAGESRPERCRGGTSRLRDRCRDGCQPEKGLASTISTLTSRPLGAVYDTVSPTDAPSMAEPSGDWGL
jgi:hypothetical protein